MDTLIRDLTSHVSAMNQDATLRAGLVRMLETGEPDLLVVDDEGRLVGVVPDYELLKAMLAHRDLDCALASLVSSHVPQIDSHDGWERAAALFRDASVRFLLVVEGGRIVGQIRRHHILDNIANRSTDTTADASAPRWMVAGDSRNVTASSTKASGAESARGLPADVHSPSGLRPPRFMQARKTMVTRSWASSGGTLHE